MSEPAGEPPCRGNHPPSQGEVSSGAPNVRGVGQLTTASADPRRLIQCPSLLLLLSALRLRGRSPGSRHRAAACISFSSFEHRAADRADTAIRHTGACSVHPLRRYAYGAPRFARAGTRPRTPSGIRARRRPAPSAPPARPRAAAGAARRGFVIPNPHANDATPDPQGYRRHPA